MLYIFALFLEERKKNVEENKKMEKVTCVEEYKKNEKIVEENTTGKGKCYLYCSLCTEMKRL